MAADVIESLPRRIDHAALGAELTEQDVLRACKETCEYGFFGFAVNPVRVRLCRDRMTGTDCHIVGVAGFPLGANRTDIKMDEAVKCVSDGAREIDMVANIGWLREERFEDAAQEIRRVREALPFNVILKVIIEASLLTPDQQEAAAKAVVEGGAQFVKTGTGFAGPATVEQVQVIREAVGGRAQIKAAGGIKTLADCRALLEAGATRLGSSSSVAIMQELRAIN